MKPAYKREELPEVLDPKLVQEILNIGRRQTYELLNKPPFHIVRVGKLIKVPKESFFKWIDGA